MSSIATAVPIAAATYSPGMTGTIALQGGGPFAANDELDARLLGALVPPAAGAGAQGKVVVLPTADAYEQPERLVTAALSWGERLDVEVEALMVLRRADALEEGAADVVRGARAVYLVGDNPMHLRSALKDTPLLAAIEAVVAAGGVLVACAGSAAALCDPMVDMRGGAFTLGLGVVAGLALVTQAEAWSPARLTRTLDLANTPVAVLATGSALVRSAAGWERIGAVDLRGDLPG